MTEAVNTPSEVSEGEDKLQNKPLSENAFVAFFQKIARWWMGHWSSFKEKHPKGANLLYQIFFFIVFSEGVTIWQYLVMTFLPYVFIGTWETPFIWPQITLWTWSDGTAMIFGIFNEPIKYVLEGSKDVFTAASMADVTAAGGTVVAGGLGNFIAFEIAVFTAQCINFPLQRNITFRSHGNVAVQIVAYFIGWVAISILTNAVWGFVGPILTHWQWADAVANIIKTIITGGLSMVVFFFIFLWIFPNVDKDEAAKQKKMEENPTEENKAAYERSRAIKERFYAEKSISELKSIAEQRITKYLALKKICAEQAADAEGAAENISKRDAARAEALEAVEKRDTQVPELEAQVARIKAQLEEAKAKAA